MFFAARNFFAKDMAISQLLSYALFPPELPVISTRLDDNAAQRYFPHERQSHVEMLLIIWTGRKITAASSGKVKRAGPAAVTAVILLAPDL